VKGILHIMWWSVYPFIDCDEHYALIYLKNTSVFEIISHQIIY
jgi:hypothetical protein